MSSLSTCLNNEKKKRNKDQFFTGSVSQVGYELKIVRDYFQMAVLA